MSIRSATVNDAPAIARLLAQLGYPDTEAFLGANLQELLADPMELLLVWAEDNPTPLHSSAAGLRSGNPASTIAGFLSADLSIYPELKGRVATIKAFAVDETVRSKGIGRKLEAELTRLATEKGCDRIIVHCAERRIQAHQFYYRQGYTEDPKYLIKKI
jgi:GNAT superfamily N-acetyltransferase